VFDEASWQQPVSSSARTKSSSAPTETAFRRGWPPARPLAEGLGDQESQRLALASVPVVSPSGSETTQTTKRSPSSQISSSGG
jgi:hypothetical protein